MRITNERYAAWNHLCKQQQLCEGLLTSTLAFHIPLLFLPSLAKVGQSHRNGKGKGWNTDSEQRHMIEYCWKEELVKLLAGLAKQ